MAVFKEDTSTTTQLEEPASAIANVEQEFGGLGDLGRLPWDIRERIYGRIMDWVREAGHARRYDKLAVLRASHALHNDVTSFVYDGWALIFTASPFHYYRTLELGSYQPIVEVQLSHARHRGFRLPPLQSILQSELYRSVRHSRWQAVIVELVAPPRDDPGAFIISWRASKLIASVLATRPPATINLRTLCDWFDSGVAFRFDSPSKGPSFPLLMTLAAPFRCMSGDRNSVSTSQAKLVTDVTCSFTNEKNIRHLGVISTDSKWVGSFRHKVSQDPDFIESWVDYSIDCLTGGTAQNMRNYLLNHWDVDYERSTIRAMRTLDTLDKRYVMTAFVERWATTRRMNKVLHAKDVAEWLQYPVQHERIHQDYVHIRTVDGVAKSSRELDKTFDLVKWQKDDSGTCCGLSSTISSTGSRGELITCHAITIFSIVAALL